MQGAAEKQVKTAQMRNPAGRLRRSAWCVALCFFANWQYARSIPVTPLNEEGLEQSTEVHRDKSLQWSTEGSDWWKKLGDGESLYPESDDDPEVIRTRVWAPQAAFPGGFFPEFEKKEIMDKPSTGICFSGGGYRSYIATLGYLRGLLDLGLLDTTRYMFGISGGSWAVLLFSYYAR